MSEAETNDDAAVDVGGAKPGSGRVLSVYLIVQVTLFLGLTWKWWYFKRADAIYHSIQLSDSFFPQWLQSADVIRYVFFASLVAIIVGVMGISPWVRRLSGLALVGCLFVMLIHQASYNDMTFATSLWVAIWSFWFTTRMDKDEPRDLLRSGAFLARVIGSMILLGGAVGKWTPEYWSGEVMFDIYFRDRDFWLFNYLRDTYDAETLRTIATWYSRKIIAAETLFGFGMWLLPSKWAAAAGVTIFFSIAFFSNLLLFSVLWCLVGLSAVGFLVMRKEEGASTSQ